MGKRFLAIIISMIIFFPFHIYGTGSVMALVKIVDETPWKSDVPGEQSPVRARTDDWIKYWIKKPLSVMGYVLNPQSEFNEDVQKRTLWATPVVYLIVYYIVLFGGFKKRKYDVASKYGSHGTSRWATAREILRNGALVKTPVNELNGPGVILGYKMGSIFDLFSKDYITLPPDSEYNQNVIAYGGSGIGKTHTYVKAQILNTIYPFDPANNKRMRKAKKRAKLQKDRNIPSEYSLVVVDPKGENYRDTSGILEKNDYKVWMINLIDLFLSAHWNPMDYVRDDLEAEQLSITIISNSSLGHRGGGADPFWERAENALLAALILFVKYELPSEQQNLTNVLQIVLSIGEDEEKLNGLFNSLSFNHPAKMKFDIFRLAEDKTRTGILIGFASHLQLWTNQNIQDLTAQSDFLLGDLGKEKMALFLVIPDADKKFKSITSLFFAQCFQEWWLVARKNSDVLPVGIRLIMDEFANIGYIPDFDMRMSVMRSKGVSAQIILQTRSQLDNLYKDSADIIAAACDTTVFLGTNDDKTAKAMSDTLGDMTIRVQSSSSKPNKLGGDPSNSEQYQERKLMKPDEIKRNSRKINIIVQNGAYPFKVRKTPYNKHPLFKDYEKRQVEAYQAPKTKPWEYFDCDAYLANAGVFNDLLERDAYFESESSHQTVLHQVYNREVESTLTDQDKLQKNYDYLTRLSTSPADENVETGSLGDIEMKGNIAQMERDSTEDDFEAPIEQTVENLALIPEQQDRQEVIRESHLDEVNNNEQPSENESTVADLSLSQAEDHKRIKDFEANKKSVLDLIYKK